MKTQEEYAREIEGIILRDVESCQGDWFNIDKEIFMQPENENKVLLSDLIMTAELSNIAKNCKI